MPSILLLALAAGLSAWGGHDDPKSLKTARPAKTLAAALGRCSGNAYCSACRNCSACGHCAGGGGTCGVCAPASTPVRTYRTPARTRSTTTRSYSGGGSSNAAARPKTVLEVSVSYYVNASTLNLRAEPLADAEVIRTLGAGDIVTVLELVDEKWARVSAESAVLGDVEGYVARAYLSSQR